MKLIFRAALLILFTQVSAANDRFGTGRLEEIKDEFTGDQTLRIVEMGLAQDLSLTLAAPTVINDQPISQISSSTLSAPFAPRLFISSSSQEWLYLDCHDLNLLIDGVRTSLDTEHDGEVSEIGALEPSVSVDETIYASIPVKILKSIASAEVVRGRLCFTEFTLSESQKALIAKFLDRLVKANGSATEELPGGATERKEGNITE